MPIYLYKGVDATTGDARKGKVEAESPKAARHKLRTRDKIITSDLKEEVAVKKGIGQKRGLFAPKVKLLDIAVLSRQFAVLQQAHVPLDESLKALTQQVDNPVLRNTLAAIKDAVSEGKSLADALAPYPDIFNRLYVNMVRAGESSGNLALVLVRLADFLEYQVTVQGRIFSAVTYPLVMICASMGTIAFLVISVIPKMEKVFSSMRLTLPWYSSLLIEGSKFVQHRWYLIGIGGAGLYFLFNTWRNTTKGRLKLDRWSLKAPIFGPVIMRVNVSKFTKTLSTLLSSGVPIISALEITKNVISNQVIAQVVEDAKKAVQEGDSLATTIERSEQFPPLVSHMIRTGEKTGELEEMLRHVAEAYDAEVERKISAMISLIEPMMIILMGGVAVCIVLAVLVPMMSVMSKMR